MLRNSLLLCLISLAFFLPAKAANALPKGDSLAYNEAKHRALDTVQVAQYFLDGSKWGAFYCTTPDTSLQRFQFNQPHQKTIPAWFMQSLLTGAVGSAVLNPDDPFNYQATGFNLGRQRAYLPYRLTPDETPIYRTHRAYSNLSYAMGSHAESIIDIVHAQQLGKKFYGQVQFRNYGSEGAYTYQKTAHKNAHVFLEFKVKRNYRVSAGLLVNDSRLQENAGTLNDSVFLQNYIDKNVVPVRRNATQTFKDEIYYFTQNYHPKNTNQHWAIEHHFRSSAQYQHYADKNFDSLNYLPAHISLPANDSLVFNAVMHRYSNEVNFLRASYSDSLKMHPLSVQIGLRHEYIQAKVAQESPFWNQLEAHFYLEKNYNFTKKYWTNWTLQGTYYLNGYNQGNYSVRAVYNQSLRKLGNWVQYSVLAYVFSRNADYLQQYGNYFPSANSPSVEYLASYAPLKNQGQFLGATVLMGRNDAFRLRFKYNILRVGNLVYLDSQMLVNTLNRPTVQQRWSIEGIFKMRGWHLQTAIRWNRGMSYPLQMPSMSSFANLYYEKHYFNNALEAQIGVDVMYMKGYCTPTFEPLWNDFIAQNKRIFNYQPSLGFFINARIEDARIFFRMDQLLQGVNGKGNYTGYAYPQYDRAFHVGVSWQFKD